MRFIPRTVAMAALSATLLLPSAAQAVTHDAAWQNLSNASSRAETTGTAERAEQTWREKQGQRLLDKVKARDWDWVKPRLSNPSEDFPEIKRMRKDKPLVLAATCDPGSPPKTTGICYVKNTWSFGLRKKGDDYVFYGFAVLD